MNSNMMWYTIGRRNGNTDADDDDNKLFGKIGYTEPSVFEIRKEYDTQDVQYGAHEAPYKNLLQSNQLTANDDFGSGISWRGTTSRQRTEFRVSALMNLPPTNM